MPTVVLQAIVQAAKTYGARVEQPLPLNTAYVCWQLTRHEQLSCILDMLSSALARPGLTAGFLAALAGLGKDSHAKNFSDLLEVCCMLQV